MTAKPRAAAKAKPRKTASKTGASTASRKTAAARKAAAPKPRARKAAAKKPTAKAPAKRRSSGRTPKPKGLEASYSGKIFRSRLEARWALLLDCLGIDWDYEPCHYQVGPALYYLPDFYLPRLETWLEVKGIPFMDSESMAKVLAAVAGPLPIPLREAPHTRSTALLLGGSLHLPQPGKTPVHTLVTAGEPGKANLSYAKLAEGAIKLVGPPWDVEAATGVKKARRPAAPRLAQLLDPPPIESSMPSVLHEAYRAAAGAEFLDGKLSTMGLPAVALSRRAGRWLPEPGTLLLPARDAA